MKYSSFKYSEFILAFQLQFGTYEAESERFRWERREKRHFSEWFSRQLDLLYFGHLADVKFLKSVLKEILTLFSMGYFKNATVCWGGGIMDPPCNFGVS